MNKLIIEEVYGELNRPVGVSEYTLTTELPRELAGKLPGAREIEAGILREVGEKNE